MLRNQVSKSTNIREFNYLPENIRDGGMDTGVIRRNPISPLELFAASRIMANSQSLSVGRKMSRKEKAKLANQIRAFGESSMIFNSPIGRGSMMT